MKIDDKVWGDLFGIFPDGYVIFYVDKTEPHEEKFHYCFDPDEVSPWLKEIAAIARMPCPAPPNV